MSSNHAETSESKLEEQSFSQNSSIAFTDHNVFIKHNSQQVKLSHGQFFQKHLHTIHTCQSNAFEIYCFFSLLATSPPPTLEVHHCERSLCLGHKQAMGHPKWMFHQLIGPRDDCFGALCRKACTCAAQFDEKRKTKIFTLELHQRGRNFPNQKLTTWSKCSKGTNFQSPWTLRCSHAPTLGHVWSGLHLWRWKCGNFPWNLGFGEHLGNRNDDQKRKENSSTREYETVVFLSDLLRWKKRRDKNSWLHFGAHHEPIMYLNTGLDIHLCQFRKI